jgi:phosphate-selective porin OprO and OprP
MGTQSTTTQPMKLIQSTLLATSLLGITSANAENGGFLFKGFSGDTALDRTWSMFDLYKNDDNQILQEFKLQGRLHVQSIYGDADENFNTSDYKDAGNDETVWGNDIEARRARIGFKSKWFQNWKFDGMINVDVDGMDNSGSDTLYKDLYDLYVTYAPSDAFNISAGKTKVKFTREQETSSNNIQTLERSLLSNTLFPGELTGIWTSGKGIKGGWLYELGIYGNDRQREFSDGDGGEIVLAKIGYDYAEKFGFDSAVASIHYMTNSEPNYKPTNTPEYTTGTSPNFKSSIAITNEITQGRFGLMSDVMLASGDGSQSDVMGITLIPSYFIAEGLQLVGRLQVATSEDRNDLRLPSRFERLGDGGDERGNTYTSVYAGLNYYIYGHKLKLMNGIEYSHLGGGDYDGYTFMSGLRFSF